MGAEQPRPSLKDLIQDLTLYAFLLRIPLLMLALIWPILPYLFTTPLFRGLADLQAGGEVGRTFFGIVYVGEMYVVLAGFETIAAAVMIAYVIAQYGPTRVGATPARLRFSEDWLFWFSGVALAAYFGFLWSLWKANETFGGLNYIAGVLAGIFLAAASLFIAWLFSLPISHRSGYQDFSAAGKPSPWLQFMQTYVKLITRGIGFFQTVLSQLARLGVGFYEFDEEGKPTQMLRSVAFATGALVVFLGAYLAAFGQERHSYPTLFWVIELATLILWVVAVGAFWLDRYRAPVMVALGALITIASIVFGTDSFYRTHDIHAGAAPLLTPSAVLSQSRFHPRMILVAAAGGGIHAAGWTARVLTGLKESLGERFDNRVAVVSGVSGGSVGSFFYLRTLPGYPREPIMPSEAFNGAVKSSLEDVALSLMRDRGTALETSFADHAEARGADLEDLARNVGRNFPVVIFNATMAQAARPIVFTNSKFPDDDEEIDSLKKSISNFYRQCANQDANVETAVRMSATFPFVSPAARARLDCLSEHLVDGGYYDNYGLTSLNAWLRQAVGRERWGAKTEPGDKPNPDAGLSFLPEILLIQIVSFPKGEDPPLSDEHWLYQLTVPVSVMLNVRGTGQTLRNEAESWAVLQDLRSRGAHVNSVVFRYSPDDCACSARTPSLSWHLSTPEIACLRTAWEETKMKPCRDAVAKFVRGAAVDYSKLQACQQ